MDDKDSKKARKAAKKPVPWSSLTIGNWYQCRFEFTEARTQPATADSNSPLSITPTRIKNKSYRILLIAKQGVEVKTAICLYLTSFGGSGKTPSEPVADKRYLKYVPVNATPVPAQTPFYTNIEVDAKSLHGFLNYVDEQKLPGDGINVQSSQRIINMPESLSLEGERVPISSPSWTLEYLKNLKALWVNHIMWEDSVENMAEACEAVTRAYKPIEVGKKRVWTEDDSEESKDMDEHLSDPNQPAVREDIISQGIAPRTRKRARVTLDATIALALLKNDAEKSFNLLHESDVLSYPNRYGDNFDSGIYDMDSIAGKYSTPLLSPKHAETSEDPGDSGDDDSVYTPAQLVRLGFYEIDEDDIDEMVDLPLLEELFR